MRNTLMALVGLAALTAAAHASSHTLNIFPGETTLIGNGAQTELWAQVESGDLWTGIGLLIQPTGTLDVTVELANPYYGDYNGVTPMYRWDDNSILTASPEAKGVAVVFDESYWGFFPPENGIGLGNSRENTVAGNVDPNTGAILLGTITVNSGYGDLYFGVGTFGMARKGCDDPTQDVVIFGDADPLPCNKFDTLADAPIANAPMLEVLVPEPASLALLALVGLFGVRRR